MYSKGYNVIYNTYREPYGYEHYFTKIGTLQSARGTDLGVNKQSDTNIITGTLDTTDKIINNYVSKYHSKK